MAGAAIGISIKLTDGSALDRLNLLTIIADDLKDEMDGIGKLTAQYAAGPVMASRGSVIGKSWAPWTPAYAAWRGANALGNQYLILSGKLSKSFAWQADNNTVEVGNNTDYWKYTQYGTDKMAARPTIGFSDPLKRGIANLLSNGIQSRLNLL